jgi:hypothetical protein
MQTIKSRVEKKIELSLPLPVVRFGVLRLEEFTTVEEEMGLFYWDEVRRNCSIHEDENLRYDLMKTVLLVLGWFRGWEQFKRLESVSVLYVHDCATGYKFLNIIFTVIGLTRSAQRYSWNKECTTRTSSALSSSLPFSFYG